MKLSYAAMLLVVCAPAWAQSNRWFDPSRPATGNLALIQVKEYLQLTDAQVQLILSNNDQYNQWSFERQQRIRQVQAEIVAETQRSPLDPGALGIRYAEIESICRQMKDYANESRTRNLDVLSEDQKSKVRVLEAALKLAALISEAQYANLVGEVTSAPSAFTSQYSGTSSSVIGGLTVPVSGCYFPFGTFIRDAFPAGRATNQTEVPPAFRPAAASRWFSPTHLAVPAGANHAPKAEPVEPVR